jgi:hypothetical protein
MARLIWIEEKEETVAEKQQKNLRKLEKEVAKRLKKINEQVSLLEKLQNKIMKRGN